jgi:hypothetical protein
MTTIVKKPCLLVLQTTTHTKLGIALKALELKLLRTATHAKLGIALKALELKLLRTTTIADNNYCGQQLTQNWE